MKLVTGIEAIQSGKSFRRVRLLQNTVTKSFTFGEWIDPCCIVGSEFAPRELLLCEWEIELEPREFWLCLANNGQFRAWRDNPPEPDSAGKWIKVREVME